MSVVPRVRYVLRGTIRAQVTYAIALGNRIITAFGKNSSLALFTMGDTPASLPNFQALLAHWVDLLKEKDV